MAKIAELDKTTITGIIETLTYRNNDNGFFVCKVKVKGYKINITITGTTPINLNVGEIISACGTWQQNHKYGMQFHATEVQLMLPKSISGIEKYLASGVIKGIGPIFAHNIVEIFKEKAIDIIENTPHKLTKIRGISIEKANKIAQGWSDNLKIKEMMLFLQSHDVTINLARKIYNNYGDAAINILRDNPYAIARDIKGIGFLSADKIAKNLGIALNDHKRISAGIEHVLVIATTSGSSALPMSILIDKVQQLLEVSKILIETEIHQSIQLEYLIAISQNSSTPNPISAQDNYQGFICNGKVIDNDQLLQLDPLIFFKPLYFMERNIAKKLHLISTTGNGIFHSIDLDNAIDHLYQKFKINLAESQKEAIKKLQNSKVIVITGGPGTGKTTLINSIIKIAKFLEPQIGTIRIKLAAPTGRAAKRITESSGAYSSTIHRMLEFDPINGGFKYNDNNHLKCDLMILDETSMIDIKIMNALLKALPQTVTLIIVGDVDQLPSIGPGQVLSDIINSEVVEVIKFNQVFRQAKYSQIITNAHAINSGKIPLFNHSEKDSDFKFISIDDDIQALNEIKQVMTNQSQEMVNDVQVLTPMQKGSVGVKSLNIILQTLLNKNALAQPYIEYYGTKYCIGDKILQNANNYNKGVFNGDIGFITNIDQEEGQVIIHFDGFDITYDINELDQISLAYAITIHKSQGSEYHTVVMPILTQHFIMLNKNLLYTGITRAKKKLILIGQKRAIAMAVKSNKIETRYSMLKSWLSSTFNSN